MTMPKQWKCWRASRASNTRAVAYPGVGLSRIAASAALKVNKGMPREARRSPALRLNGAKQLSQKLAGRSFSVMSAAAAGETEGPDQVVDDITQYKKDRPDQRLWQQS